MKHLIIAVLIFMSTAGTALAGPRAQRPAFTSPAWTRVQVQIAQMEALGYACRVGNRSIAPGSTRVYPVITGCTRMRQRYASSVARQPSLGVIPAWSSQEAVDVRALTRSRIESLTERAEAQQSERDELRAQIVTLQAELERAQRLRTSAGRATAKEREEKDFEIAQLEAATAELEAILSDVEAALEEEVSR